MLESWSKRQLPFLTTTTQKQVRTNMSNPHKIYQCFTSFVTIEHKSMLQYFFLNILQKYYQLPIVDTLGKSGISETMPSLRN